MIRTLLKIGADHYTCEDNLYYNEGDHLVHIAIFDGCSKSINPAFASGLFSKIVAKSVKVLGETDLNLASHSDDLLKLIHSEFKVVRDYLNLQDVELMSTIVLAIINKHNDECILIVSGDGSFYMNDSSICNGELPGLEYKIESEGNRPNYMAYHNSYDDFRKSVNISCWSNAIDVSVTSDGINSYKPDCESAFKRFFIEKNFIKSDAMLARNHNILENGGYSHFDDVSVVRYIKN